MRPQGGPSLQYARHCIGNSSQYRSRNCSTAALLLRLNSVVSAPTDCLLMAPAHRRPTDNKGHEVVNLAFTLTSSSLCPPRKHFLKKPQRPTHPQVKLPKYSKAQILNLYAPKPALSNLPAVSLCLPLCACGYVCVCLRPCHARKAMFVFFLSLQTSRPWVLRTRLDSVSGGRVYQYINMTTYQNIEVKCLNQ